MVILISILLAASAIRVIYVSGRTGEFISSRADTDAMQLVNRAVMATMLLAPVSHGVSLSAFIVLGGIGIGLALANTFYAVVLSYLFSAVSIGVPPAPVEGAQRFVTEMIAARVCYDLLKDQGGNSWPAMQKVHQPTKNGKPMDIVYFGYTSKGPHELWCGAFSLPKEEKCPTVPASGTTLDKFRAELDRQMCLARNTIIKNARQKLVQGAGNFFDNKELVSIAKALEQQVLDKTQTDPIQLADKINRLADQWVKSVAYQGGQSVIASMLSQTGSVGGLQVKADPSGKIMLKVTSNGVTRDLLGAGIATAGAFYWTLVGLQDQVSSAVRKAAESVVPAGSMSQSLVDTQMLHEVAKESTSLLDSFVDFLKSIGKAIYNALKGPMYVADMSMRVAGVMERYNNIHDFLQGNADQYMRIISNAQAILGKSLSVALAYPTSGQAGLIALAQSNVSTAFTTSGTARSWAQGIANLMGGSNIPILDMRTLGDWIVNLFAGTLAAIPVIQAIKKKLEQAKLVAELATNPELAAADIATDLGDSDSGGSPALIALTITVVLALFGIGVYLAYVLPALPIIYWFSGLLGYIVFAVETMFALPLWVVSLVTTAQGDRLLPERSKEGLMILLHFITRPALMLIGLIAGFFIMNGMGAVANAIVIPALDLAYGTTIFAFLAMLIVYAVVYTTIITTSMKLVHNIPDAVLGWINARGSQAYKEATGQADQEAHQRMGGLVSFVSTAGRDVMGAKGKGHVQKAKENKGNAASNSDTAGQSKDGR